MHLLIIGTAELALRIGVFPNVTTLLAVDCYHVLWLPSSSGFSTVRKVCRGVRKENRLTCCLVLNAPEKLFGHPRDHVLCGGCHSCRLRTSAQNTSAIKSSLAGTTVFDRGGEVMRGCRLLTRQLAASYYQTRKRLRAFKSFGIV